uniref:Uncharacterized protein n=1 Tax=Macrostomum lignano TaxID=282301 RepID=A0A1I8F577_9PLAT
KPPKPRARRACPTRPQSSPQKCLIGGRVFQTEVLLHLQTVAPAQGQPLLQLRQLHQRRISQKRNSGLHQSVRSGRRVLCQLLLRAVRARPAAIAAERSHGLRRRRTKITQTANPTLTASVPASGGEFDDQEDNGARELSSAEGLRLSNERRAGGGRRRGETASTAARRTASVAQAEGTPNRSGSNHEIGAFGLASGELGVSGTVN